MWCVPSISAASETVKQKPRESIQNLVTGYSPAHILRAIPVLAGYFVAENHSTGGSTSRNQEIKKRIGWHTFRHSYSSLLVANGENVKVVQELMRHASSRFTLDVYSQARKGRRDRPSSE
jgi:integrase